MSSRSFEIRRFESVPSTQDLLKEMLHRGESVDHLVIRASRQESGRGRFERAWQSPEGGSYQSLAVADPEGALRLPQLSLLLALGIAEVLARKDVEVAVKWPNDLYLPLPADLRTVREQRVPAASGGSSSSGIPGKLGGILCEHARGHLLVGVGLNVQNRPPPPAGALQGEAVEEVSDWVLAGVGLALDRLRSQEGVTTDSQGRRLEQFDLLRGKHLRVELSDRAYEGEYLGVNRNGFLLLRGVTGVREIRSGRIEIIDAPTDKAKLSGSQ